MAIQNPQFTNIDNKGKKSRLYGGGILLIITLLVVILTFNFTLNYWLRCIFLLPITASILSMIEGARGRCVYHAQLNQKVCAINHQTSVQKIIDVEESRSIRMLVRKEQLFGLTISITMTTLIVILGILIT